MVRGFLRVRWSWSFSGVGQSSSYSIDGLHRAHPPMSSASPQLTPTITCAVRVRGPYTCELKCREFNSCQSKISHCEEGIIPNQIQFYFRLPFDSQNIEKCIRNHFKHKLSVGTCQTFTTSASRVHFQTPTHFQSSPPHTDPHGHKVTFSHREGG